MPTRNDSTEPLPEDRNGIPLSGAVALADDDPLPPRPLMPSHPFTSEDFHAYMTEAAAWLEQAAARTEARVQRHIREALDIPEQDT